MFVTTPVRFTEAVVTTPSQEFETLDGSCFIATAAYGANWTDEVRAMRYFRDAVLRQVPVGRDMVRFYYRYGPALAHFVAEYPVLRSLARMVHHARGEDGSGRDALTRYFLATVVPVA